MVTMSKNLTGLLVAVATVVVCFLAVPSANAQLAIRKEVMERLFFNQAQRSVLESVRQGVVDRTLATRELEDIETTEIEVPQIVFKTFVVKEVETGRLVRESDLSYNGMIRQHGGEARLIIDGVLLEPEELAEIQNTSGISFDASDDEAGSVITSEDRLFQQQYQLRRGDTIRAGGSLSNSILDPDSGQRFIIVKRN